MSLVLTPAGDDARLDACLAIWDAITPDEPASPAVVRARSAREPRRLHLLATFDGAPVACGFAGPSQTEGRGFVSPRVLPEARRRGVGTTLLLALCDHLHAAGFAFATAHVDGHDPGAVAFAEPFGFVETGRQVEQVMAGRQRAAGLPLPGARARRSRAAPAREGAGRVSARLVDCPELVLRFDR